MIGTGTIIIHQPPVLKCYPKVFLIFLLYLQLPDLRRLAFLLPEHHEFFIHEISVIEDILHRLTVYRHKSVPRFRPSSSAILSGSTLEIICFLNFIIISLFYPVYNNNFALKNQHFEKTP